MVLELLQKDEEFLLHEDDGEFILFEDENSFNCCCEPEEPIVPCCCPIFVIQPPPFRTLTATIDQPGGPLDGLSWTLFRSGFPNCERYVGDSGQITDTDCTPFVTVRGRLRCEGDQGSFNDSRLQINPNESFCNPLTGFLPPNSGSCGPKFNARYGPYDFTTGPGAQPGEFCDCGGPFFVDILED